MVSPSMATEMPNWSPDAPSAAVSLATSFLWRRRRTRAEDVGAVPAGGRPRRWCRRWPRSSRSCRPPRHRRPSAWPPGRTWRRRRSCGRRRLRRALAVCTDHDGVAVDRHAAAEFIVRRGVVGRQLGHLVRTWTPPVGRRRKMTDPRSAAVGSNHNGVAVDGHGDAEVVPRCAVRGRQLGHLAVVRRCGVEDVGRAPVARRRGLRLRWCCL